MSKQLLTSDENVIDVAFTDSGVSVSDTDYVLFGNITYSIMAGPNVSAQDIVDQYDRLVNKIGLDSNGKTVLGVSSPMTTLRYETKDHVIQGTTALFAKIFNSFVYSGDKLRAAQDFVDRRDFYIASGGNYDDIISFDNGSVVTQINGGRPLQQPIILNTPISVGNSTTITYKSHPQDIDLEKQEPVKMGKECECGGEKHGWAHSSWCPLYRNDLTI